MNISELQISAQPALDLEAPFRRTSGWIGADGNYSVPLGDGRIAWLFSDTFVGTVKDGKRIDTVMINNSVGIQNAGSSEPVQFYYGSTPDGGHSSFVIPDEGEGYFWLFDGVHTNNGLYFFLLRVKTIEVTSGFPFETIGLSLAHVPNPEDTPDKWKIEQRRVPFCRFGKEGTISYASATMKDGGYVYMYGIDSAAREGVRVNNMIVARVPEDQYGDFGAWRFLSGGEWGTDWEHADGLFPGVATEYSVSWLPAVEQYAAIYTVGITGIIELRLSPTPVGPWTEPVRVFECPDKHWHKEAISYAGKAHPELATAPNELILTYAANSMCFDDLMNDARMYWPRFVRVRVDRG